MINPLIVEVETASGKTGRVLLTMGIEEQHIFSLHDNICYYFPNEEASKPHHLIGKALFGFYDDLGDIITKIKAVFDYNTEEIKENEELDHLTMSDPHNFLYVMKNERNSLHKIGISYDPSFRERTFQSEEPEVKLVAKFKGLAHFERSWHIYFADERCRGEWFDLKKSQIRFMIHKCLSNERPPQRKANYTKKKTIY
tara:strand:- start:9 stop:602 length:594 start_codon:yes stop_codon:yes gene_type:complete